MKKLLILFFSCCALFLHSQEAAKVDTGRIDGAAYKILFPPEWNKKLVMFAHGYEFMGSPVRQSKNPQFTDRVGLYLERGFAVAASDYRKQGFALPEGVEDTEALRKHFVAAYGQPDSTLIVGVSMGGGVALGLIEHFGEAYDGAMPLCPLSSRPYLQVRKEFDLYATFNGLFPGIAPSLHTIFDLTEPYQPTSFANLMNETTRIRTAIMEQDSVLALAFAKRYDLKLQDLPFSLFFNENVLRDIAEKAGGNPFDNTNTVYSGFPDDLLVNQKAERLEATVDPNLIFGKYDRTGLIEKPVLMVHTLYDQLIPPDYGVVHFENMVHKQGKDEYLTIKYTSSQGHCNFTPEQISRAFDELRHWVNTGKKAEAGQLK